jgi:hypothetical protein
MILYTVHVKCMDARRKSPFLRYLNLLLLSGLSLFLEAPPGPRFATTHGNHKLRTHMLTDAKSMVIGRFLIAISVCTAARLFQVHELCAHWI